MNHNHTIQGILINKQITAIKNENTHKSQNETDAIFFSYFNRLVSISQTLIPLVDTFTLLEINLIPVCSFSPATGT